MATVKSDGLNTIVVDYDEYAENPRDIEEPVSKLYTFERGRELDECPYDDPVDFVRHMIEEDFTKEELLERATPALAEALVSEGIIDLPEDLRGMDAAEMAEAISEWSQGDRWLMDNDDKAHIERLCKYEHGGVRYFTSPTASGWDTSVVGYAVVTRDRYEELCPPCPTPEEFHASAAHMIDGELAELQAYLDGEVYRITQYEGLDEVETVHGFYPANGWSLGMDEAVDLFGVDPTDPAKAVVFEDYEFDDIEDFLTSEFEDRWEVAMRDASSEPTRSLDIKISPSAKITITVSDDAILDSLRDLVGAERMSSAFDMIKATGKLDSLVDNCSVSIGTKVYGGDVSSQSVSEALQDSILSFCKHEGLDLVGDPDEASSLDLAMSSSTMASASLDNGTADGNPSRLGRQGPSTGR